MIYSILEMCVRLNSFKETSKCISHINGGKVEWGTVYIFVVYLFL